MAKFAVLDTDIIRISLETTESDPSVEHRRSNIALAFERMEKQEVTWVVPAPVVAELYASGSAGALLEIAKVLNGVRVQPLDEDAARLAGQLTAAAAPG